MAARKKYSKEFKLDPIQLLNQQGYYKAEVPRKFAVSLGVLGKWLR